MESFADTPIAITLTGAEWFAILAKLADKPLSDDGRRHYQTAGDSMTKQLKEAAKK